MLDVIGAVACLFFAIAAAALIWALVELEESAEVRTSWRPGTRPYTWRF